MWCPGIIRIVLQLRKYVGDRAVDQQQGGRGVMRNRITAPGAGESDLIML